MSDARRSDPPRSIRLGPDAYLSKRAGERELGLPDPSDRCLGETVMATEVRLKYKVADMVFAELGARRVWVLCDREDQG